jgi:hypothetical protein
MACEVSQFTLSRRGDETAFEQAMLEQISNPLGVAHIGLASWYGLDVLGIDHEEFKLPF